MTNLVLPALKAKAKATPGMADDFGVALLEAAAPIVTDGKVDNKELFKAGFDVVDKFCDLLEMAADDSTATYDDAVVKILRDAKKRVQEAVLV